MELYDSGVVVFAMKVEPCDKKNALFPIFNTFISPLPVPSFSSTHLYNYLMELESSQCLFQTCLFLLTKYQLNESLLLVVGNIKVHQHSYNYKIVNYPTIQSNFN